MVLIPLLLLLAACTGTPGHGQDYQNGHDFITGDASAAASLFDSADVAVSGVGGANGIAALACASQLGELTKEGVYPNGGTTAPGQQWDLGCRDAYQELRENGTLRLSNSGSAKSGSGNSGANDPGTEAPVTTTTDPKQQKFATDAVMAIGTIARDVQSSIFDLVQLGAGGRGICDQIAYDKSINPTLTGSGAIAEVAGGEFADAVDVPMNFDLKLPQASAKTFTDLAIRDICPADLKLRASSAPSSVATADTTTTPPSSATTTPLTTTTTSLTTPAEDNMVLPCGRSSGGSAEIKTCIELQVSSDPVRSGTSVTFTAYICNTSGPYNNGDHSSSSSGPPLATGTVAFSSPTGGGLGTGTVVPPSGSTCPAPTNLTASGGELEGTAAFTVSGDGLGAQSGTSLITATYSGDATYLGSASKAFRETLLFH